MARCSLRDRDLRTKYENMNSRTRVSSARAPSHSPQDEISKKAQGWQPGLAKSLGCQTSLWWQDTDEIKLGHQSAGQGLDQWGHGCGSAGDQNSYSVNGAGTNSPRLSRAEMDSLAHGYAWGEAPGEVGQGQKAYWCIQGPDKSNKCYVWFFRFWGCRKLHWMVIMVTSESKICGENTLVKCLPKRSQLQQKKHWSNFSLSLSSEHNTWV